MNLALVVGGAAPVALGMWMLFQVKRRRFQRRNQFGVEIYRSYTHLIAARSADRLQQIAAWVVTFVGAGIMVHGGLAG